MRGLGVSRAGGGGRRVVRASPVRSVPGIPARASRSRDGRAPPVGVSNAMASGVGRAVEPTAAGRHRAPAFLASVGVWRYFQSSEPLCPQPCAAERSTVLRLPPTSCRRAPRFPLPAILITLAVSFLTATLLFGFAAFASDAELWRPETGAWDLGVVFRLWATISVFSLPVSFIFGVIGLVVVRSLGERTGAARKP